MVKSKSLWQALMMRTISLASWTLAYSFWKPILQSSSKPPSALYSCFQMIAQLGILLILCHWLLWYLVLVRHMLLGFTTHNFQITSSLTITTLIVTEHPWSIFEVQLDRGFCYASKSMTTVLQSLLLREQSSALLGDLNPSIDNSLPDKWTKIPSSVPERQIKGCAINTTCIVNHVWF